MDIWSWPLSAIGIFGYFLLGVKHRRSGWLVGVLYNVLWVLYAVATKQWGFIAVCIFFVVINALGYIKWEEKND